jgi:hypothetical protein
MKHTDSTTRTELFKNNTKTVSQENEISTMSEITQAAKMRPWLGMVSSRAAALKPDTKQTNETGSG